MPFSSPAPRSLFALCLAATCAAGGCKPADEGRRTRSFDILGGPAGGPAPARMAVDAATAAAVDADEPGGALPVVKALGERDAAAETTETAPDAGAAADVGPSDDALPAETVAHAGLPDALPIIDSALAAELARPVASAAQSKARDLNKSGLAHARRHELLAAVGDYSAALAAWPAFPVARYNLACARAVLGENDAAIEALSVLDHLATVDAAAVERLRVARADKDFDRLRGDPRFRRLTGATDVVIAWVPGADGAPAAKARAKVLADQLRDAKWPAQIAPEPWNRARPELAVEVRADDPIAMKAAPEVARALGVAEAEPRADWPADTAPIVVFVPSAAADTKPADGDGAPGERGDGPSSLADLAGKRLTADAGGGASETLELRATGFFTWQRTESDGMRRIRTGRWKTDGAQLELSYKETRERPAEAGKKPRVDQLGEHRETLPWSMQHGALVIGGAAFRAGDP